MSSNSLDVIIIGAGVAGSSAAYELANAGLKVIIIEKEKLPRYKTCGGGVVLRAANLLPFQINSVIQCELRTADVFDQENKIKFHIEREMPAIYMTMRAEFDLFLLNKAVEKGALLTENSEVKEIKNKEEVKVTTQKESFHAKFVVACDGATGFTMTRFKLNQNLIRVPAVEAELFVDDRTFDQLKNSARFDFSFVPNGYGWVFPKMDHLSVGVAFMKKVNQSIQDWFKKYLSLLGIKSENILKNEKHGYVIPFMKRKTKYSSGRILFAGDCLGFVNPLTAEGISYAIRTGQLAARAIVSNYKDQKKVTQKYKSDLEYVYREVKAARLLSKVVYGPLALRKFIFRHWGKKLSELLTDVITDEKEYSNLIRNPVNYLKLFRPVYWR